jgi:hypothetical protein
MKKEKSIKLSNHAQNKIKVLKDLGFEVKEEEVVGAIKNAECTVEGKKGSSKINFTAPCTKSYI